jgi:Uncharacterised nucleotidyltransferase
VNRRALRGRVRPTEQQRLLLRCGLGDDTAVREAWARVSGPMDFDDLDEGSHGVLPLVYRALVRAQSVDGRLPRMKGIYRKAWFANQLLLDTLRQPLGMLRHAGCDPLLLHGTAMMAAYYPETGLRRIPFLDVAVRPGTEEAALKALLRSGWSRHPDGDGSFPVPLLDVDGRMLSLNAGLPEALQVPGVDGGGQEELWARARTIEVVGVSAQVLEPTDQLLCVCAVGPDLFLTPQAQWLADAAVLVAGGEIDWAALTRRAQERRVTARVRAAMDYLADELGLPVPDAARLPRAAVPRRERLAYRLYVRRGGPLGGLPQTLAGHVRATADLSAPRALAATPRFLGAHLRQRRA